MNLRRAVAAGFLAAGGRGRLVGGVQLRRPGGRALRDDLRHARQSTSTLPRKKLWWRVRADDSAENPGAWSSVRQLEIK